MKSCLYCNKNFIPKTNTVGKYCSIKCCGLDRIGKPCPSSVGRIPWNKGKKMSLETRKKQSEARLGVSPWNKGIIKVYTKICEKCGKLFQKPYVINSGRWKKAKFCSIECSSKGNGMWKGGITPINTKIRNSDEFIAWAKEIKKRDGYECQICGEIGGKLNSHHIKPFSKFPDLRFDINNGITLCHRCHHTWTMKQEDKWESYFNFNLSTRGVLICQ